MSAIARISFIVVIVAIGIFSNGPLGAERAFAIITASSTMYSTAGTFTYVVSTNACQVIVDAWGGGGAGFDGNNAGGGKGGGAAAFASSTLDVSPGSSYTIVVGTAGSGSGGNGGDSTFDTTTVVADGGLGGTNATTGGGTGGTVANSTGQTRFAGGDGGDGNGSDDGGGGGGGAGGPHGAGNPGVAASATAGGDGGSGDAGQGGTAGSGGNGGACSGGGSHVNGGGGGGGADQNLTGCDGGAPGGGGGGGELGQGNGAAGQIKLTELVNSNGCVTAPTVETNAASDVTPIRATLNGNITATGGSNATERGFAWGTDSTLSSVFATTTESGSFEAGVFTKNVSGLIAGVTYYFRAYATNPQGTGYGSIQSFPAGTDTGLRRILRLFGGFKLWLPSGKIIVHQAR